jgi:ABC-2 type transport system ATP-binding protein
MAPKRHTREVGRHGELMPRETAAPPQPVLAVRAVSFGYRQGFRLDDISFSVPPGVFTALLGANGAGKSTLFALLTRLFDAEGGEIRISGHDLRRDATRALSTVGVVFQQPTLDLDLSVQQNLRYMAALQGLSGTEAEQRISTELDRLGLEAYRRARLRVLSGGTRRRVELARALLHRPALLLLDEPTVGLDPPTRQMVIDHVRALTRDGAGVLWATHLIDEVTPDDQVVVLHGGRVGASGSVSDINELTGCMRLSDSFAKLISAPCEIRTAK